jgi:hypothetical protein
MENSEKTTKTVSVELTAEQYAFLTDWQKTHEQELGIEVPIGAVVRKAVDAAMKFHNKKDDRPPRQARPAGRSFDRPGFNSGPRKPFGSRAAGGPRFGTLGVKNKPRTFNK